MLAKSSRKQESGVADNSEKINISHLIALHGFKLVSFGWPVAAAAVGSVGKTSAKWQIRDHPTNWPTQAFNATQSIAHYTTAQFEKQSE